MKKALALLGLAAVAAFTVVGCGGTMSEPSTTGTTTSAAEQALEEALASEESAQAAAEEEYEKTGQAKLGETLTWYAEDGTEVELTVLSTKKVARLTAAYVGEVHPALFAVQLRVKNTGTVLYDECVANCAVLIDSDDGTSEAEYGVTDANYNELPGSLDVSELKLTPGDTRKGWIYFRLAPGTKARKFQYTPMSGWSEAVAEWTL